MRRSVLTLLASLAGTWAIAQYNTAGRIHVAIGAALGGHGTSLEETFKLNVLGVNLTQTRTKTGAAATSTLPFEVGVGLGKVASIGLLIEMGRYVPDTNSTDQRNAVAIVALQPRFYLLNRDRFALSGSLALGGAALHIVDDTPYKKWDGRYSGPAFGLGAGVHVGLGEHVALEFHLRYIATRMELRAGEWNGSSVTDFYSAKLTTAGAMAQLGLAFRFGGR